jgi:NAD(P)H-dependent FMN reductase
MRILAISGSLQAKSLNTELLRFAASVAPPGIAITICDGLDRVPHFNPDLDKGPGPAPVMNLRAQLTSSEAVLICSPEYAHGVPGTLKNALDWLVGRGELVGKPVAVLNLSERATHAHASLIETLHTMAALVVPDASVALPMGLTQALTGDAAKESELAHMLNGAVTALVRTVTPSPSPPMSTA